jgi:hypothetical protein
MRTLLDEVEFLDLVLGFLDERVRILHLHVESSFFCVESIELLLHAGADGLQVTEFVPARKPKTVMTIPTNAPMIEAVWLSR